jgi:DNA-binding CsgD family transcriptional regulator
MATSATYDRDLLEVVEQMEPEEFDAFIEQALARRSRAPAARLSKKETELIQRINRGLPAASSARYAKLARKRDRRTLTATEHAELLRLTHDIESRDAERAQALWELAQLRGISVRALMKQLGIKAPPVDA